MIAYVARCPGCGNDCWFHSYPTTNSFGDHQRAEITVHCPPCNAVDRAKAAQRTLEST